MVAEDLRLFVKTVLNFHVVATVLLEREIHGPGAEVSEMERQTGT